MLRRRTKSRQAWSTEVTRAHRSPLSALYRGTIAPAALPCSWDTSRPSSFPDPAPLPFELVVGPRPSPPSASAIQEMVPPPREKERLGQTLSQEMRAPEPARPFRAGATCLPLLSAEASLQVRFGARL